MSAKYSNERVRTRSNIVVVNIAKARSAFLTFGPETGEFLANLKARGGSPV